MHVYKIQQEIRPKTLLVPLEEICKRVLCNEHIQHHLLIVRREIPLFFGVLFTMFLVYHDFRQNKKIKNKN